MTRSSTVSLSSATGSVVTVGSAPGMRWRIAAATASLSALTRSSGSVRLTATARSMKVLSPTARARTCSTRDHAGHFRGRGGDLLGGACRRRVGQRVDGAAAEPPAGDADQDRDHERGGRIRPPQADAHAGKPDQHGERGPQVGRKMQRVGFQRLALRFFGGARERARAEKIDRDRHRDHAEGPGIGDHRVLFVLDQSLDRLPDHHAREQEQQRRFGERRDAFDLAVAVMVLVVGRLAGNAHRAIGHHRGAEVDQRMAGLRQDRQRAGGKADHALGDGQRGGRRDRGECDLFFFVLHAAPLARWSSAIGAQFRPC